MQEQIRQRTLGVFFTAVLLAVSANAVIINDATPLTGTVVSVNRDLHYVTIRDDVTGRNFKVDTRGMNQKQSIDVWNLRAGDRISATGSWENNDTYRAVRVTAPNPRVLDRMANGITGTVVDVNRDLNYFTIRDEATGQTTKVDVRGMDSRRSINVWQLRNGDVVMTHGTWSKEGTFRADFVNFGNNVPMASAGYSSPNVVTGVVENVNRGLNYFTVRDDVTGRSVKIDVRQMDTRRSVNVWNLRAGDRITIDGTWNPEHDRFQAEMVRF